MKNKVMKFLNEARANVETPALGEQVWPEDPFENWVILEWNAREMVLYDNEVFLLRKDSEGWKCFQSKEVDLAFSKMQDVPIYLCLCSGCGNSEVVFSEEEMEFMGWEDFVLCSDCRYAVSP